MIQHLLRFIENFCFKVFFTTGNLLDHELKNSTLNKPIAVDLNKEIDLENSDLKQQINFIGTLDKDSKMFFIIEKSKETTVEFSQNAVTVVFLV